LVLVNFLCPKAATLVKKNKWREITISNGMHRDLAAEFTITTLMQVLLNKAAKWCAALVKICQLKAFGQTVAQPAKVEGKAEEAFPFFIF